MIEENLEGVVFALEHGQVKGGVTQVISYLEADAIGCEPFQHLALSVKGCDVERVATLGVGDLKIEIFDGPALGPRDGATGCQFLNRAIEGRG